MHVVAAHGLAIVLLGCGPAPPPASPAAPSAPPIFVEVTEQIGITVPDEPWPDGTFFMPEITPPGLAVLDYDSDGDLDLLHVRLPRPGHRREPAANRLYRREADGTYLDVSAASGLADPGYGQGVAVGDADGDGDPDVYFTNYGRDAFYLNNGDGTFTDATERAGFSGEKWSASATFCDYDRDSDLDLFVTHYVRYDPDTICTDAGGKRDYCAPNVFPGEPDSLFRNDGGSFTEVTREAGIVLPDAGERARGLGVVCADFTDDGWMDFYVANDGESNQLWVNGADGTFADEGVIRGVAVNRHGIPEASMGVAVADVDGNGALDLYMTHLFSEHNRLYMGGDGALFRDGTQESAVGESDLSFTGFGCAFLDFDLDGDPDLAVANGKVRMDPKVAVDPTAAFWEQYAEPNLFLENVGSGRFRDASGRAGAFTQGAEVSRGLVAADLDDDGDPDLVMTGVDDTMRVFRNDADRGGSAWIRIRARSDGSDALGAKLILRAGGSERVGIALRGSSYLSSGDPRVAFALAGGQAEELEVLWPDGARETFPIAGRTGDVTVDRGNGTAR